MFGLTTRILVKRHCCLSGKFLLIAPRATLLLGSCEAALAVPVELVVGSAVSLDGTLWKLGPDGMRWPMCSCIDVIWYSWHASGVEVSQ